jgi:hypothetical protein
MTTPNDDPTLHALALLELVQRLGSGQALDEYCCLAGAECEHQLVNLCLADVAVTVSQATGFNLQSLIDERRERILTPDEPRGMA